MFCYHGASLSLRKKWVWENLLLSRGLLAAPKAIESATCPVLIGLSTSADPSLIISSTGVEIGLLQPVTATQSSTHNPFSASKCIDGDTEGPDDGHGVDMCHTNNERAPWIAIDYGKTVTVQRVEIFNRVHCCGDRTKNVDIRISNELPSSGSQMFSGGALFGHFPGPATDGQHIIISGKKQLLNSHY